jgi:type IV pilus assembly protein PilC
LQAASGGLGQLHLNFDQEPGGKMLDLAAIVNAAPADAHFYACGPAPMLAAYQAAASQRPPEQVHWEHFSAAPAAPPTGGFQVHLARSARSFTVAPGASILDTLLDRLALYMEKTEAIKAKIKSALTYPIAVLGVAGLVVTVIMLFVVPAFKDMFASFGSELPRPTLILIAISEFFVNYWYLIFGGLIGGFIFSARAMRASTKLQAQRDRLLLRMPVFGGLIRKSCIARWTRTLATMFAAGVPLVEALESVGGASGNIVYLEATARIRQQVSSGVSLTAAMTQSNLFPPMVLQMCAIGEESGSIDYMLGKSADFFEAEVDEAVAGISSLMEPFIIVFLGTIIGGMVVALYLPIFKMGQVV